ncbi:hypothetical protein ACFWP2_29220 [Kitasatospora sp. NPDC058444]|uniref:hypothetical protein n=1 Tax=Kitasatospora sp. NPDC058444 TaxID=3346504 RepID=UPI00365E6FF4
MADTDTPRDLDELAKLIPEIRPIDGAPQEVVAIGERYWALAGFVEGQPVPVWSERTSAIDTTGWGRQHYVIAAAGVRATIPGRCCPKCAGPLTLTSRNAFQQVCLDATPDCVDCTTSITTAAQLLTSPTRLAKVEERRVEAEAQQVVVKARTAWAQQQQAVVDEQHPTVFPSSRQQLPKSSVRAMLGTLAVLRYAPTTTPITDVASWPVPLHPDPDAIATLLGDAVQAGLLAVHSSSPLNAFLWEPASYDDALAKAGGDLGAAAPPVLTHSFYPSRAHYFAPYGASLGKSAEALDALLAEHLDIGALTVGQQDDLLVVARELIAAEALRYFRSRLEHVLLPVVPDNHAARLHEAALKVAEHRPLGEIYNLVWRATRAAAEAAQANPRAPRANMTTYAVNHFETQSQRASVEADWPIKPFSELSGQGPAAMTRVLFYGLFDSNPVDSGLSRLRDRLPTPAAEPLPASASSPQARTTEPATVTFPLAWLSEHPTRWKPSDVPAALSHLTKRWADAEEPHEGLDGVAHASFQLAALFAELAPVIGGREAALAVVAAVPQTVAREADAANLASWITAQLGVLLLELSGTAGGFPGAPYVADASALEGWEEESLPLRRMRTLDDPEVVELADRFVDLLGEQFAELDLDGLDDRSRSHLGAKIRSEVKAMFNSGYSFPLIEEAVRASAPDLASGVSRYVRGSGDLRHDAATVWLRAWRRSPVEAKRWNAWPSIEDWASFKESLEQVIAEETDPAEILRMAHSAGTDQCQGLWLVGSDFEMPPSLR